MSEFVPQDWNDQYKYIEADEPVTDVHLDACMAFLRQQEKGIIQSEFFWKAPFVKADYRLYSNAIQQLVQTNRVIAMQEGNDFRLIAR